MCVPALFLVCFTTARVNCMFSCLSCVFHPRKSVPLKLHACFCMHGIACHRLLGLTVAHLSSSIICKGAVVNTDNLALLPFIHSCPFHSVTFSPWRCADSIHHSEPPLIITIHILDLYDCVDCEISSSKGTALYSSE
jgi:hypothetical protein